MADDFEVLARFVLEQQFSIGTAKFEFADADEDFKANDPMLHAKHGRKLLGSEQVVFYADADRTIESFRFTVRDLGSARARVVVRDPDDQPVGEIRFDESRAKWRVQPEDGVELVGAEPVSAGSIFRRLADTDLGAPTFVFHRPDGAVAFSIKKSASPLTGDRYEIALADPGVDVRLLAALAVAMDIEADED